MNRKQRIAYLQRQEERVSRLILKVDNIYVHQSQEIRDKIRHLYNFLVGSYKKERELLSM